jgi:hypothetical protein
MKGQLKQGLRAAALTVASVAFGFAQTASGFTGAGASSADRMPPVGAVNYVEGQASIDGQPLSAHSAGSAVAGPNQVIDTGTGYVEVLLTPGTFLRIGHDSEVRVLTAGLVNTKLDLSRGSALIESAEHVKGTDTSVVVNGVTTEIEKNGLYAFDANQGAIKVLDGKATVLDATHPVNLTKGHEFLVAGNAQAKRDFSVRAAEEDPLYVWSKVRSQSLASENMTLANNIAAYGGWYGPGWYWNPYWSSYAFLPAYGFAGSPFGFGFYSPIYIRHYGYYGHGLVRPFGAAHTVGVYRGTFHGGGFHGGGFHGGRR